MENYSNTVKIKVSFFNLKVVLFIKLLFYVQIMHVICIYERLVSTVDATFVTSRRPPLTRWLLSSTTFVRRLSCCHASHYMQHVNAHTHVLAGVWIIVRVFYALKHVVAFHGGGGSDSFHLNPRQAHPIHTRDWETGVSSLASRPEFMRVCA